MNTQNIDTNNQGTKRITCMEFEAFIINFIDGHLTEEQQQIFNVHIEECERCKIYLMDYQNTIELNQAAFNNDSDESFALDKNQIPEELVQAVLKANKQSK